MALRKALLQVAGHCQRTGKLNEHFSEPARSRYANPALGTSDY